MSDRTQRITELEEELESLRAQQRSEGLYGRVERALQELGLDNFKVNTIQNFRCDGQVDFELPSLKEAECLIAEKLDRVPAARVKEGWLSFMPLSSVEEGEKDVTLIEPAILVVAPCPRTLTTYSLRTWADLDGFVMAVEIKIPPSRALRLDYELAYNQQGIPRLVSEQFTKPEYYARVDKYGSSPGTPGRRVCWCPLEQEASDD